MDKKIKITLLVVGVLLLLNGLGNIVDDARILTYDIASILSGIGFIVASRIK
jgi:ABC-type transport system involved in multi-copper enzyme maturation permease subunit